MNINYTALVYRVFLLITLLSMSALISHSANFYEDTENEEFFFYTSNPSPTIDLSIESQSNSVLRVDSILFNSESREYNFLPQEILAYESANISFNFPQNLINELAQNAVFVELEISSSSTNTQNSVKTIGDPTSFNIEYIDSTQITHYSSQKEPSKNPLSQVIVLRGNDEEITFHFNNKIVEYDISIGSQISDSASFESNILSEVPNQFSTNIQNLRPGTYPVEIFYKDIAGNENIESFEISISNPPLEISKVYSMQDSKEEYNYYFNSKFNENRIYSNTKTFDMAFETNYEASCYIEQVGEFKDSFDVNPKTEQVKTHSLSINMPSSSSMLQGMWVMCEDVRSNFREEERVYLSEKLFENKELIDFEYIEPRDDFTINTARPNGVITYTPIKLEATTNYPSVCQYSISNQTNYMSSNTSSNFLQHFKSNVLPVNEGEFEVDVTCIDKLYNTDTKILDLEIDTSQATQLVDWEPKFTASEMVDFEIEISDETADCGIITNLGAIGSNNVDDSIISPTREDGSTLFFEGVGPFSKIGENNLNLKCETQAGIIRNMNFYVTYDPVGPSINSVDLFNEEFGPTEFFSKSDYMKLEIESDSSSVEYYTVEFENSNILINSSSSSVEVEDNFSQDTSVKISAIDSLGRESNSFTKNFQYDTQAPTLSIQTGSSSSKKEVICSDSESNCAQISYGTSSIESSCLARTSYDEGDEIDIFGKNYLCVEAIDEAGNRVNLTEQVSSTSSGPFDPSVNDTDDDSENGSEDPTFENPPLNDNNNSENEGTNDFENESEDPFDPIDPAEPTEEEGFNWLLLSAFAFILLATGGGGYYAYRKGYLDQQLAKMGIATKKKGSTSSNSTTSNYSSIPRKELDKNKFQSATAQDNSNQSKYDSHINKLNSFINSTLNKDSAMFDEFEKKKETKSQNKNNLKETLIKNKAKENDEKDSFEKFHKSMNFKSEDTSNKKSK